MTISGATWPSGQPAVEGLERSNGTIIWRRPERMDDPIEFTLETS